MTAPETTPETRPRPLPAGPTVLSQVVAVVAATDPEQIRSLLDQFAIGTVLPGSLLIVAPEGGADIGPVIGAHRLKESFERIRIVRLPGDASVPATPAESLATILSQDAVDWPPHAWLLNERCRPAHAALEQLAIAMRSESVGMVAPKVRTHPAPARLVSVGYVLTKAGRWIPQPTVDERDQGQFDDRSDVLASSSLGALIDLASVAHVGAPPPHLRSRASAVAGDVDLGWRLHRSGRRVLVVPSAVVALETRESTAEISGTSRRALRSIALGAESLSLWPLRILGVLATALVAIVVMLLAKRPRAAGREVIDGLSILRLDRAWEASRRFAKASTVRRRSLAGLFVPRDVARQAVIDDLVPERRDQGILNQQDLALRGSRPQAVAHPAFLAVLAALALTLAAGRDLGGSLFGRVGWGVTGGEVTGSSATAATLWRAAFDPWSGPGLGAASSWSPSLAILAIATWIGEHLPLLDTPPAPASAAVAGLLVLTLPAAALSMYAALSILTPRRSLRGFGGLAWAATGLAIHTIGQGRLGGAVVLVLLPLAAATLARALGRRGRSYDAAQAGLLLAVIAAFAPVVTIFVAVIGMLLGLAPAWSFRRAAGAAIAPVIVLAPFVQHLLDEPHMALGGIGLFDWGGTPTAPWRLLLLDPTSDHAAHLPERLAAIAPFAGALVLALAAVGLLRGRHRLASLAAVIVAGVALAATALTSHIVVDTVPVGTANAGEAIRPWSGALLPVYAVIIIGLAVRGLDVLARLALKRPLVRPLAPLVGLVLVAGLLVPAAWAGFGTTLSTYTDQRPEVAVDHADGPLAGRSLLITRLTADAGADGATAYRIESADNGMPVRSLPEPVTVGDSLDQFVSRLDSGALDGAGDDLPGGAAEVLARYAIGFIAISGDLPSETALALDSQEGLRRLPDRGTTRWWRVDSTTEDVPSPARVVLRSDDGSGIAVPSSHHGQTDTEIDAAGTLEVAEVTSDWALTAEVTLDGQPLAPINTAASSTNTVTYALDTPGHLVITQEPQDTWLKVIAALGLLIIGYLALPFGGIATRPEPPATGDEPPATRPEPQGPQQ